MDAFEINLVGNIYLIKPLESGAFAIFEGDKLLGVIEPVTKDDTSLEWVTADLMSVDLAQQIGELIEEHEM